MTDKNQKLIIGSARIKIICTGLILGLIFVCFSGYLAYQYMKKTKDQRLLHLNQTVQIARNSIEPILVEYRAQNISMESALEQSRNLIRRMVYKDLVLLVSVGHSIRPHQAVEEQVSVGKELYYGVGSVPVVGLAEQGAMDSFPRVPVHAGDLPSAVAITAHHRHVA